MTAHPIQLSLKPEVPGEPGLPKRPAPRIRVRVDGVEGDFNAYRTQSLGGDPDQAVLLLTEEVLLALRAEGWPVQPGDLGENLTLAGVPESALRPGTILRIGTVRLEVSKPCEPCRNLYALPYVGRERGPEFLRTTKDRRGWYARVLEPGEVTLTDSIDLEQRPGTG